MTKRYSILYFLCCFLIATVHILVWWAIFRTIYGVFAGNGA